jgi:hypothetical protein
LPFRPLEGFQLKKKHYTESTERNPENTEQQRS